MSFYKDRNYSITRNSEDSAASRRAVDHNIQNILMFKVNAGSLIPTLKNAYFYFMYEYFLCMHVRNLEEGLRSLQMKL